MTYFRFIGRELGRNLRRGGKTLVLSAISLTLLLLLFNLAWITLLSTNNAYTKLYEQFNVEVFLDETLTDSTVATISDYLTQLPGIMSVQYVSKDDARAQLEQMVGVDLLIGYDSLNPLPHSFLLSFQPESVSVKLMSRLEIQLRQSTQNSTITYSKEWLEATESNQAFVRRFSVFLAGFILFAIAANSSNTIRLAAKSRASGFQELFILGASRSQVAVPYIIEGFLLAGISAAMSWVVVHYVTRDVVIPFIELTEPAIGQKLIATALVALLGGLSALLGIRGMLKYYER